MSLEVMVVLEGFKCVVLVVVFDVWWFFGSKGSGLVDCLMEV